MWAREAWPADLLTHFRPYVLALEVVLVVLMRPGLTVATLMLATLVVVHMPYLLPGNPPAAAVEAGPRLRLMTANVMGGQGQPEMLVDRIRAIRPDLLALEEATPEWRPWLAELADILPYGTVRSLPHKEIVVLSRYPLQETEQLAPPAGAVIASSPPVRVRLAVEGTEAELYVLHPDTPRSPRYWQGRNRMLGWLAERVRGDRNGAPVLVAGDFNTATWSPFFRDFVTSAGLVDAGGGSLAWPTRQPLLLAPYLSFLGSPVDHVLVSPGVAVLRYGVGPDIGSDHLPIIAEVRLPAGSG